MVYFINDKALFTVFTSAFQVMFVSMVTFAALIPIYLFFASSDVLIYIVGFHVIFIVMISHLIIEIIAAEKFSIFME